MNNVERSFIPIAHRKFRTMVGRSLIVTLFSTLLPLATSSLQASPPPGMTWTQDLSRSDEFNGTLDMSKWVSGPLWYSISGVLAFKAANATVTGGCAEIKVKKEVYNGQSYTTGALKSIFKIGGGNGTGASYTEVRAKMADSRANLCSAIWLCDQPTVANNPNVELDLQETSTPVAEPGRVNSTLHKWPRSPDSHTGLDSTYFFSPNNLSGDFHTYGVERRDGRIRMYLDGVMYANFDASVCPELVTQQRSIVFNIEGHAGTPVDAFLPATSLQIDYVRVYSSGVTAPPPAADSAAGYATSQIPGSGWNYGYAPNLASNDPYSCQTNYQNMTWSSLNKCWQGVSTYQQIKAGYAHPDVSAWTVRRWNSNITGPVNISGLASVGSGGDGINLRIFAGSTEIFAQYVNASISATFNINRNISSATPLDFCITRGAGNNYYDGTQFLTSVSVTADTGPLPAGLYRITPRHAPSKCLDVTGSVTTDGGNVQIWAYAGGQNQKWNCTRLSDNTYRIFAAHSGKYLSVAGEGSADGTNVQQWADLGNSNGEQWILTATDSGFYRVIPKTNTNSALDVNGFGTTDGTNVQIWGYGSGYNQQWKFEAP